MHPILKIIFCLSMCSLVGAEEHYANKSYQSSLQQPYTEILTAQLRDSINADGFNEAGTTLVNKQAITPAIAMAFLQQHIVPICFCVSVFVGFFTALNQNQRNAITIQKNIAAAKTQVNQKPLQQEASSVAPNQVHKPVSQDKVSEEVPASAAGAGAAEKALGSPQPAAPVSENTPGGAEAAHTVVTDATTTVQQLGTSSPDQSTGTLSAGSGDVVQQAQLAASALDSNALDTLLMPDPAVVATPVDSTTTTSESNAAGTVQGQERETTQDSQDAEQNDTVTQGNSPETEPIKTEERADKDQVSENIANRANENNPIGNEKMTEGAKRVAAQARQAVRDAAANNAAKGVRQSRQAELESAAKERNKSQAEYTNNLASDKKVLYEQAQQTRRVLQAEVDKDAAQASQKVINKAAEEATKIAKNPTATQAEKDEAAEAQRAARKAAFNVEQIASRLAKARQAVRDAAANNAAKGVRQSRQAELDLAAGKRTKSQAEYTDNLASDKKVLYEQAQKAERVLQAEVDKDAAQASQKVINKAAEEAAARAKSPTATQAEKDEAAEAERAARKAALNVEQIASRLAKAKAAMVASANTESSSNWWQPDWWTPIFKKQQ